MGSPPRVQERDAAGAFGFDEVYRRHADAIYRFCLSQVRNPAIAEDLAGDVFASAFAAYGRVRPDPDDLRRWLFRIARNAVIDEHRRSRLRDGRFPRVSDRDGEAGVERDVIVRADLRAVCEAITTLRPRDQVLVGLRIAGGLSHAEVGRVTGMSENAARVATQRAVERIRKHMESAR